LFNLLPRSGHQYPGTIDEGAFRSPHPIHYKVRGAHPQVKYINILQNESQVESVLEYEGTKLSLIFSAVGQTIWIFPETLTAVHSHVLESIMATFVVEENFARAGLPVILPSSIQNPHSPESYQYLH
jgi:hypothetical protein